MKISKTCGILAVSMASLVANPALHANDLTEIIVTAKGEQSLADVLPTSHVYTAQDISAAQAVDLPSLLDEIGGVSVAPTGGRGTVTGLFLRGTALSQNIVMIDGVRIGSASLGQATINAYPLEAIERIEVVKGPLSGIYGADAVGGVIQVFTKSSIDGMGSANLTVGNNNLIDYGASVGFGNDTNHFLVSANFEETDGIDATSISTGGNEDIDGFEETSFNLAGKFSLGESTSAHLSILYADNEAEFDNTFGEDTGFITQTTTISSALNIRNEISDNLLWTTRLGKNTDESVTEVFFSDIKTKRDVLGTDLAWGLNDQHMLTFGVDYYNEEIESTSQYPVSERDNTGVFALLQSSFDRLSFAASLRFDDNSAYGSETNGSIALNYDLSDQIRATLSYGTAFSAPSFNFLYFPFFGNPDLLPEESTSTELTLRGQHDSLFWRVSGYQTDIENLFSFDSTTFLAANIGKAEIEGIEFELGTQIRDWQVSAHLDVLSAQNLITGIELDDRAEQTLSIVSQRSYEKLDLRLAIKAENGRYDNQGTELDGYGVVDVNMQYHFNQQLSLFVSVDNLLDKDYTLNLIGPFERYNTLGRQARLSMRYSF